MSIKIKIQCFEYLVKKILEYDEQYYNSVYRSSFTKLKLQKLLFLVSASQATEDNKNLLDIFDNFYAMENGPVESDIYNAMLNNSFSSISFVNREMSVTNKATDWSSIEKYQTQIDSSFTFLLSQNPDIIKCTAAHLVNITHKWDAWKMAISIAEALGKRSEKMEVKEICCNSKYYK